MRVELPSTLAYLLTLCSTLLISFTTAIESKNAPRARGTKAEERNLYEKLVRQLIQWNAVIKQKLPETNTNA